MKVITKGGFCSTKNLPIGFQFVVQNDGRAELGGSFNAQNGKVPASPDALPSKLYVADSYRNYGCKYCNKKCAYVCPECGVIVCNDGNGNKKEVCPSCGSILEVERAKGSELPAVRVVKRAGMEIAVTAPRYDNIGKILRSLRIEYEPFQSCGYNCNLLFLNCGSSDRVDPNKLRDFVQNGGCVYASDLMSSTINAAFPGLFDFYSSGNKCKMYAEVVDQELRSYVGDKIKITFDLGGWSVLRSSGGTTLLKGLSDPTQKNNYGGLPIMVKVPYGNGTIFYTCFHNHSQASAKEKALLQLLVLKQMGSKTKRSIEEVGAQMGVNVAQIKAKFR